ncbi:MAG: preprotein translocase subunit SecE [Firmicutes bacterium HGW-Firmicutes-1]|jgi:preprotein translocase subunit SecE|nr:MAG: preprotein translocase subunit SecE [Firmicutes bacterium HGW-Firmicutes-1]
MGEASVTRKTSFFKGVKGEFKKIIWPNVPTLMKQTWTVIIISAVVGGVVAAIDVGYIFIVQNILGIV